MTVTLDALRRAYEADPADAWEPYSDALEESGDVAAAARVRLLGKNGWRWQRESFYALDKSDRVIMDRRNNLVACAWLALSGATHYWGTGQAYGDASGYCDGIEAAQCLAEDWLLAHGY